MRCLVIGEHDGGQLKAASLHALTAARVLGDAVDIFIAGENCQASAKHASAFANVVCVDDEIFAHPLAEPMSQLLVSIAKDYQYILTPATTFGKNILPRLAALLDVGQVSDIISIASADTFKRPIYAGNAIATVKSLDAIKCITVRTTAFEAAEPLSNPGEINTMNYSKDNAQSAFVKHELTESERPELTSAKVIISGGRGVGSKENFALIEHLADKLNAAIGASRAAVDAGFVPNDYQVGQTGKIVAPSLYIAIGISGAIQHLAGMKDSKIIVAINKDEDAPIFNIATYGLVGDLFKLVPELIEELN